LSWISSKTPGSVTLTSNETAKIIEQVLFLESQLILLNEKKDKIYIDYTELQKQLNKKSSLVKKNLKDEKSIINLKLKKQQELLFAVDFSSCIFGILGGILFGVGLQIDNNTYISVGSSMMGISVLSIGTAHVITLIKYKF